MIIGVSGQKSSIAKAFSQIVDQNVITWSLDLMPMSCPAYLICTGYLAGEALPDMSRETAEMTWRRNFVEVAEFCDLVIASNPAVRICVIGSESGISGSFDMAYAGAKAALHHYVRTKRLRNDRQQLVGIAPHIILDTNMTQRRDDLESVKARGAATRLGRWISAMEVAEVAKWALTAAPLFLSNTIIELRGDAR